MDHNNNIDHGCQDVKLECMETIDWNEYDEMHSLPTTPIMKDVDNCSQAIQSSNCFLSSSSEACSTTTKMHHSIPWNVRFAVFLRLAFINVSDDDYFSSTEFCDFFNITPRILESEMYRHVLGGILQSINPNLEIYHSAAFRRIMGLHVRYIAAPTHDTSSDKISAIINMLSTVKEIDEQVVHV